LCDLEPRLHFPPSFDSHPADGFARPHGTHSCPTSPADGRGRSSAADASQASTRTLRVPPTARQRPCRPCLPSDPLVAPQLTRAPRRRRPRGRRASALPAPVAAPRRGRAAVSPEGHRSPALTSTLRTRTRRSALGAAAGAGARAAGDARRPGPRGSTRAQRPRACDSRGCQPAGAARRGAAPRGGLRLLARPRRPRGGVWGGPSGRCDQGTRRPGDAQDVCF
jgi:hypothetical protein